jgi:hypothetical protein
MKALPGQDQGKVGEGLTGRVYGEEHRRKLGSERDWEDQSVDGPERSVTRFRGGDREEYIGNEFGDTYEG